MIATKGTPARGLLVRDWLSSKVGGSPVWRVACSLLPFAVLLLVWQASVGWVGLPEALYPTPRTLVIALGDLLRNGVLLAYVWASLVRYAAGVACGMVIGIPIGLLLGLNRQAANLFTPLFNFFQAIVEMAWIPIFVLWFGYGFTTILISLTYVVAFPVIYNTLHGIQRVPKATIDGVRVLGGKWYHIAFQVVLPGALPDIVTGVRLGAGYAFRGLIGAEMIAATAGLGYMLFEARQQNLTGRIVVGMLVLGLLWLFIDRVYLRAVERATVERWGMVVTAEKE